MMTNSDATLSGATLADSVSGVPLELRALERSVADRVAIGGLVALIYLIARPPLYQRDGFMYHLFARDFLGGANPHHLLWNGVQVLIARGAAFVGVTSVLPFQLAGMLCGAASAVLLYELLLHVGGQRLFAASAAVFVALTPWSWFMVFQNQPYALMFMLLILFIGSFASKTGEMPLGWRFAAAAASGVAMISLQQAAVLIVAGAGLCFLILSGVRRALFWASATGVPTAVLYIGIALLKGVRTVSGFAQWLTAYLHSQHSLQSRFPESLPQSVMGLISAFINQERFKEAIVERWSAAEILWFYGLLGVFLVIVGTKLLRPRRRSLAERACFRAVVWICLASIASWGFFCLLWEPTNYYWYVLLAPFFVYIAAELRLTTRRARTAAVMLGAATIWNVVANHALDLDGAERAPEPQLRVLEQHLRPNDVLWVVDLGWSDGIDYDLLSSTLAFERAGTIGSMSDLVGRSRDTDAWQRALQDSSQRTIDRGGRVFLSDRVFDPDAFDQSWASSPFADYRVERPFPIDWVRLSRELPAFVEQHYDIRPAGFLVGADTIWRLQPIRQNH